MKQTGNNPGAGGKEMTEQNWSKAVFWPLLTMGVSVPADHKLLLFWGPTKASGPEMP